MGITLRQALTFNYLKSAKVIGGSNGLDREIWLVNVMEVPDIVNWVSPDELILTTGYPFKDSPTELVNLIRELHKKNVAGLAIKPNRFIKELPYEAIKLADELDFPIISLPLDAQFDKIIMELFTKIINQDYYIIKKTNEIHKTLTDLVLDGSSFIEISQALSNLCFGEITVKDVSGNILAKTKPIIIDSQIDPYSLCVNENYEKQVKMSNQVIASITLESWRKSIENEDIIAIDYAATIIAMILFKIETSKEKEKRHRNEFLNNLISRRISDTETALAIGKKLGIDLKSPYIACIIKIHSILESVKIRSERETLDDLDRIINSSILFLGKKYLCLQSGNGILVLCPIKTDSGNIYNTSLSIATGINSILKDYLTDCVFSIGIGRYHSNLLDISKSFQESQQALSIGIQIWGKSGIYHYEDLGIYQLLSNLKGQDDIEVFINNMLGNLIHHDKKKKSELILTLEQLLTGDSIKTVAERLYIHPKTLLFRKKRIEEILEISLDDSEKRLSLSIALKLCRLNNIFDISNE